MDNYVAYLTDSAGTHELPPLEKGFTRVKNEKQTIVEPLSGNQYTDHIATKRAWSTTWSYLTKEEYDLLDEIYERMKSERTYPRFTLDEQNVNLLTTRMELGALSLDDDCGTANGVTLLLVETKQQVGGVLLHDYGAILL